VNGMAREPGTVYRLPFVCPLYSTIPSKNIWNYFCLDSFLSVTGCAPGDTICPRSSALRGRPSASRAAEQTQRSSSFPHGHAQYVLTVTAAPASRVKAALSKAAWSPWPLTFWPWKWCLSHVWRGSLPILIFLGLSVLELGSMYATDRQTDVRRQTKASLNAPAIRGGT